MNNDQIKLNSTFFEVVLEPDNSRTIMKDLQKKYNINTIEFISLYQQSLLPPTDDFKTWAFQYKLFIAAEGDLGELIGDFPKTEQAFQENGLSLDWDNQDRQLEIKKTEVDMTSVFLCIGRRKLLG